MRKKFSIDYYFWSEVKLQAKGVSVREFAGVADSNNSGFALERLSGSLLIGTVWVSSLFPLRTVRRKQRA